MRGRLLPQSARAAVCVAIFLMLLAALLPAGATAVTYSGSGAGPGGNITCPNANECGGTGGTPGSVSWGETYNADRGYLASGIGWSAPPGFWTDPKFRQRPSGDGSWPGDVEAKVTNSIVDDCKSGTAWSPGNSKCVLWYNKCPNPGKCESMTNAFPTWYEFHLNDPLRELSQAHGTFATAWNVKLWREDPGAKKFKLIFERRIGLGTSQPGESLASGRNDSDPESGTPALGGAVDKWYYYGGTTDRSGGNSSADGSKGSYGLPGRSRGPLYGPGLGNSYDKQQCQSNWASGTNNTRGADGAVGTKPRVLEIPRVRPGGKLYSADGVLNRSSSSLRKGGVCYWEGADLTGTGSGRFVNPEHASQSAPRKYEFGANDLKGYGLQEALRISWWLPIKSGAQPKLDYSITAPPGYWYVIQIVATDQRENILDLPQPKEKDAHFPGRVVRGNYIRAFIANPDGGTCTPPDPKCPVAQHQPQQPQGDVTLNAETPVETQDRANMTVSVASKPDNLDQDQALFTRKVQLRHFTPQLNFSTAINSNTAGLYGPSQNGGTYVSYEGGRDNYLPPSPVTNDVYCPSQANTTTCLTHSAQLTRPLDVTRDYSGTGELGAFTYRLLWRLPTVNNPCDRELSLPILSRNNSGDLPQIASWPDSPFNCGNGKNPQPDYANAWDDWIGAEAFWESRWVTGLKDSGKPDDQLGMLSNQPLRCGADTGRRQDPETGAFVGKDKPIDQTWTDTLGQSHNCNSFNDAYVALIPGASKQAAQGYFFAMAAPGRKATARIKLGTNRPDKVSGMYLWERMHDPNVTEYPGNDSNVADGAAAAYREMANRNQPIPNTVSGQPELNYCKSALPVGAKVNSGDLNSASDDQTIKADDARAGYSATGDYKDNPACRGFAVSWKWPQAGDSAYTSDCNANYDSPQDIPVSAYPSPNQNDPAIAQKGWGLYNQEPGGRDNRTYSVSDASVGNNAGNLDPASDRFNGVPYTGERPGTTTTQGTCYKDVPGHKTTGYWKITQWGYQGNFNKYAASNCNYDFWGLANQIYTIWQNTSVASSGIGYDGTSGAKGIDFNTWWGWVWNNDTASLFQWGGMVPQDFTQVKDEGSWQNLLFKSTDANGNTIYHNNMGMRACLVKNDTGAWVLSGKWTWGYVYPVATKWFWNDAASKPGCSTEYTSVGIDKGGSSYIKSDPPNIGNSDSPKYQVSGWYPGAADPPGWNTNPVNDPGTYGPDGSSATSYFSPDTSWGCTVKNNEGRLTTGSWQLSASAEPGWGANNSGPPLDTDCASAADKPQGCRYMVQFSFSGLSQAQLVPTYYSNSEKNTIGDTSKFDCPQSLDALGGKSSSGGPGTCWRMNADYSGPVNWQWNYAFDSNLASDSNSATYVSAFGPRGAG